MTDLQGLQQRVENARKVFDQTLTERQAMRAKIAELIAAVERGVQEKNRELETRTREVEALRAENGQLQSLLSNLLSSVEAKRKGAGSESLNALFSEVAQLASKGAGGAPQTKPYEPGGQTRAQAPAAKRSGPQETSKTEDVALSANNEPEEPASGGDDDGLGFLDAVGSDWDEDDGGWEVESEAEFQALHDLGKKRDEIVLSIPDQPSAEDGGSREDSCEPAQAGTRSGQQENDSEDSYDPAATLEDILTRVDSIKSA